MPPPPPSGPSYGYGGQYGSVPQAHPQGTTILVLGILSLFICPFILGPIAWVMGNNALAEIDRNPAAYSNRGNVNAGRICGIIGTILGALIILFYILAIAAAA
jgi:hypothetical protein